MYETMCWIAFSFDRVDAEASDPCYTLSRARARLVLNPLELEIKLCPSPLMPPRVVIANNIRFPVPNSNVLVSFDVQCTTQCRVEGKRLVHGCEKFISGPAINDREILGSSYQRSRCLPAYAFSGLDSREEHEWLMVRGGSLQAAPRLRQGAGDAGGRAEQHVRGGQPRGEQGDQDKDAALKDAGMNGQTELHPFLNAKSRDW